MALIAGFFRSFFLETVRVLYEGALFVLIGFFAAGVIHGFLSAGRIARHLGGRNLRSIGNAALLGAPLPLCSCGVLPTAVGLRRKGASREAVLSFLVSTPETSADSIALTYGLLGPFFAVARPVAALFSALVAGIAHLLFGAGGEAEVLDVPGCGGAPGEQDAAGDDAPPAGAGRLRAAADYAFVTLFDELAIWFLLGVLLTGLAGAFIPEGFFARYLGSGILSMFAAVLVGIPLYMCASGSTPIASAFLLKGLNPGAVLVFLLTGPATNAATITVLGKVFGRRFLQIFLLSVVLSAVVAGLVFNGLYDWSASHVPGYGNGPAGFLLGVAKGLGLVVFLWLSHRSLRRTGIRPVLREIRENLALAARPLRRLRLRHVYGTPAGRLFLLFAVAAYLASGFYVVRPGEVGIERWLGAVHTPAAAAGLHWSLPWPAGRADRCSVDGVVRIDIGFRSGEAVADPLDYYEANRGAERVVDRVYEESIYITGDENLIDVVASAHYRVTNAARYVTAVASGEKVVRDALLWAFVREFAYRPIDRIYTTDRSDIEAKVRARADRLLAESETGLALTEVRLLDTHAPREVLFDFRDVASSKEDRMRAMHEAGVYREGTVNRAHGEAAEIVARASGRRKAIVAGATGAAARFGLLEEAAREAPGGTRKRLYLEKMEEILPGRRTVVRPDPNLIDDFELWFREGKGALLPEPGEDRKEVDR